MRTRGWGGNVPASDAEAVSRILMATRQTIDELGEATNITAVSRRLGVTRQTIYHYFASNDELISATAAEASSSFIDELIAALAGISDPAEAIVEGVAVAIERLPNDPYVGLLLKEHRSSAFAEIVSLANPIAALTARSMFERLDVDWSVFEPSAVDDIIHIVLRTMQSLILSPPNSQGPELRRLLNVWIAPAVNALRRQPV
ncbi:TetR/AcrR family transcriptional regulator [Mycolicibacterium sp. CBMA 226]|uniref:TetR/AcrR family transcriptional regulator n=1 Tax=Mycolicibacterium sp. CBMA 226 TaxID=2606611 RepID=UPI0012DCFC3C|nr:TetR/AcrR family transcriptional regulator [Mycolicibacterium sp. CBMA 226]MUL74555.1 TetR/AcrR family transcriptional regulator [Mycolicibacterium sp. CBMA 226]